jgi:hypothetical protein
VGSAGGGALCTLGNTPFALLRPTLAELARKLRLERGPAPASLEVSCQELLAIVRSSAMNRGMT